MKRTQYNAAETAAMAARGNQTFTDIRHDIRSDIRVDIRTDIRFDIRTDVPAYNARKAAGAKTAARTPEIYFY